MSGIWEIGILLMGIGVLFFSVYLGLMFKNLSETVKDARRIIYNNEREIEDIILSIANLSIRADNMTNGIANLGIFKGVGRSALSIAQKRRKRMSRR